MRRTQSLFNADSASAKDAVVSFVEHAKDVTQVTHVTPSELDKASVLVDEPDNDSDNESDI